jgi:hypothetical protein
MRQIKFSEEELKQLAYGSVHDEHAIVRRRMQTMLLKSQRVPHQKIAKTLVQRRCATTSISFWKVELKLSND